MKRAPVLGNAPLTPARQRRLITALRCADCWRAPTKKEIDEMIENFGHKLTDGDVAGNGGRVVWRCLACVRKDAAS